MTWSSAAGSLDLATLRGAYERGETTPSAVVRAVYERIASYNDPATWITLVEPGHALDRARELEAQGKDLSRLPLYGVPFSVKDSIDVAGLPTTAACPAYAFTPTQSAEIVKHLLDAGAILIGKNNLDQFATGLVGVRSPYGTPRNPFDSRYIPGGSSSGSAVAVAAGLVSFSIGTDTAGSGRVPAGFNNVVGYKPTRGLLSLNGIVPACRSLDCASVFALTCQDAISAAQCARGHLDPRQQLLSAPPASFRFGVPAKSDLKTFGDSETGPLFDQAVERLRNLGGEQVEIDYAPFRETGKMLYGGPWVAERLVEFGDFLARNSSGVHPVTRAIIEGAKRYSAVDYFTASYRLEEFRALARDLWEKIDVLLVPTSATIYTIAEVEANPVELNTNLAYYTNFANLLDCCAVAVPSGFRSTRLPFGVTLIGPTRADGLICAVGSQYQRSVGGRLGATSAEILTVPKAPVVPAFGKKVLVAVIGAHLSGMPLNYQLTERNAKLVQSCMTKPVYRLYELPNAIPPKPGLIRCGEGNGASIEVEVWEMAAEQFGSFVALVGPPLTIGTIELSRGAPVKGFLCESYAVEGARDISNFGGWR
ncbi:MAG TPA: allophanate hydrolase, partial [Verrucomicrobiae bacterium]|nr:allophanate hydrolase [Verrucomicrobiae bacterium]